MSCEEQLKEVESKKNKAIEMVGSLSAKLLKALAALDEIAARPTSERNPDGDEQAAHTMALLAKEHAARIRDECG